MKKINLMPQQSAPVERVINAASSPNMSAADVAAQGAGGGRGIPKGAPFADVAAQVGAALIDHQKRPMRLTAAGETLLQRVVHG